MAMKTASPWWFSALFAAGLLLLFLGERPFAHLGSVHLFTSGAGALLLLAITALRVWTFAGTAGDRRKVEGALLLSQAGALLACVLYVATTAWGLGFLGLDALEPEALERYTVPMTVLWTIVMTLSLVPMLMIEQSLGTARRSRFSPAAMRASAVDEEAVEAFRVREMAASGITIALAASFLMVTCNIAEQRNIRRDVSYFKTSSPGDATISIVRNTSKPIRVLMFFPEVNEVKNEVRGYLNALASAGGNIQIEEHDRLVSAELVDKYRVRANGTVVFIQDGKSKSFTLTVDPKKSRSLAARMELRELDSKVNEALLHVVRAQRTAYMTVGHGELNDPNATWGTGNGTQTTQLSAMLRKLNYEVKDLGLMQGLGSDVPEDADLVLMLAPREPLSEEAMGSLDRYLARGGKMFIVLDPLSNAGLGVLENRLGVRFSKVAVTDDKNHLTSTRTVADRRLIITTRFSSHASMTTLSRGGPNQAIPFINTGSVEKLDLDKSMPTPKRTYVLRSMNESFADENNNFQLDEDSETRRMYNLAAAIELDAEDQEGKERGQTEGEEQAKEQGYRDMRVMVFADADIFIDLHQLRFSVLSDLFSDAIKWLGGEEYLAGEIESEKDVLIQHTRSEDVLLFYGTIVGAPLLVLGFGLGIAWWRRNRTQRRAS